MHDPQPTSGEHLRVVLVGDTTGRPTELEPDPLPGTLASLPGVEVVQVRLVADDVDEPGGAGRPEDDGPVRALTRAGLLDLGADVWLTGSPSVLRGVGRLGRDRGVRVVHRARRVVGDATADKENLLTALPLADAVVVPRAEAAEWIRARLGDAAPPLAVIPPWLAGTPRPASTLDRPLFVGPGLSPERRPGQAVRAFVEVAPLLPDWRLRMLGGGFRRRELADLAAREGIRDRLRFSGGSPNLPAEWSRATIAVVTARVDPFPTDALAAMAAGVPVIAEDVPGGVRDVVEHEVNGLLVPGGATAPLAVAMHRLATDPYLLRTLAHGARRTAAARDGRDGEDVARERWAALLRPGPLPDALVPASSTAPPVATVVTPAGPAYAEPREARTATLRHVVRAAASAPESCVLPGRPPVVVVPASARRAVLRGLAADPAPGLSVRAGGEEDGPRLPLSRAEELARGHLDVVVEPWPTDAAGAATLVGQRCAVRLQTWTEALDGRLVPPDGGSRTGPLHRPLRTVAQEVDGVRVAVPEVVAAPTAGTVGFDVDVVYTWVDGGDPAWNAAREERLAAAGASSAARTASGRARFENRDELRYSMRSLHLFAPWVRRIHLVTAGQVPPWLDVDHEAVHVVDHREILPADALPTFSSHAIETALHHVDGLAEHFVYLNDDVMLGRPVEPETFFSPGGSTAVFLAGEAIGEPDESSPEFLAAADNNRRLLLDALGVRITDVLAHTPHPHRVSVLAEVERRFATDLHRTARTPFRSRADVSVLSSLAQHYGLLTGTAHVAEPDLTFLGLASDSLARQLSSTLSREQDFLCLGDSHAYALGRERVDELVGEFLADYYPVAGPWERPE